MDSPSFDRLARLFGGAASRRAGLGIAAAALLGRTGVAASRPRPEGPCKSEKRPDNICEMDSDCCTGICNLSASTRNKDGKGRCRCVRRNGTCMEDRNCCDRGRKKKLACMFGVCTDPCADLQQPCGPTMPCCTGVCGGSVGGGPGAASAAVCCAELYKMCGTSADCCDGMSCCSNVCVPFCPPSSEGQS